MANNINTSGIENCVNPEQLIDILYKEVTVQ